MDLSSPFYFRRDGNNMNRGKQILNESLEHMSKNDLMEVVDKLLSKVGQHESSINCGNKNAIVMSTPEKSSDFGHLGAGYDGERFDLPVNRIDNKLNELKKMARLIGNQDHSLREWYESIMSHINGYSESLRKIKQDVENEFSRLMKLLVKIIEITCKFSTLDLFDDNILSSNINTLITYCKLDSFKIDGYCEENNLNLSVINKEIEENLIKLIPIISQQLHQFHQQLTEFYSLYDIIEDYQVFDAKFLSQIPSKSKIGRAHV